MEDKVTRYINMIGRQNRSCSPIFNWRHLPLRCFVVNLKVENLLSMVVSCRDFEKVQIYLEVAYELTKFAYR